MLQSPTTGSRSLTNTPVPLKYTLHLGYLSVLLIHLGLSNQYDTYQASPLAKEPTAYPRMLQAECLGPNLVHTHTHRQPPARSQGYTPARSTNIPSKNSGDLQPKEILAKRR